MKLKTLLYGTLIAAAFTSCSNKDDIEGTWTGTPQKLSPASAESVTGPLVNSRVVTTLTFTPQANDSIDGTVQFSSTVSAQDEINENNGVSLDVPYEVSVSAITTASGTYIMEEDLMSFTLDKLDGQEFGGTATLNLRGSDNLTLPAFSEITAMTEEEFTALVELVSQTVETYSQMFA